MSGQEQVLRTGVLFKKGSGAGPFGRRNWKPRYFVLTPHKLQYYTFEDGDLKGEVDLSGCDENVLEVMPADSMKTGSSASTIWRVAINTPSRRLLVAAGTEMEMNDWVDKLVLAFRISSGQQPLHEQARASVYTPGDARVVAAQAGNNPVITDFQNFAAARRSVAVNMNRHSVGSHHSAGAADVARHSDVDAVLLAQADQLHDQQQRQREEEAATRHQQEIEARHHEEMEAHHQQEMEAQQHAAARAREEEAAAAAAAIAAEQAERRRQEQAEETRLEQERLDQQRLENERLEQERRERERQERIAQEEARKKAVHDKMLEEEMAMTGSFKQQDQTEALLDLQRRQKREEHERVRRESQQRAIEAQALLQTQEADLVARQKELALAAEDPLERQRREKREKREREQRERAERLAAEQQKQQQKSEFDDLEFRMTAQMNSQQQYFDVDNESDSDSDDESFTISANSIHGRRSQPERSPELASAPVAIERVSISSDTPAPRSSLIGDVKVETMRKQQAEHQRRREQSLQQEKYKLELEQQRAHLEAVTLSQQQHHHHQQDVTIARGTERGEIEIVRRPMKPNTGANASPPQVMESVEF